MVVPFQTVAGEDDVIVVNNGNSGFGLRSQSNKSGAGAVYELSSSLWLFTPAAV